MLELETAHRDLLDTNARMVETLPEPEFNDVFVTATDLTNLSAVRVLTTKVLTSEHTVSKITRIMEGMMTKNISNDEIVKIKQVLEEACAVISEKVSHKLRECKQEN